LVPGLRSTQARGTPLAADCLSLALIEAGELDAAREHAAALPELRVDYLWLLFTTVRGLVFAALGDTARGAEYYERLLPHHDLVAGSGSTGYVFAPVAIALTRLAVMLGRRDRAREHLAEARRIAEHCGSAPWLAMIDADQAILDNAPAEDVGSRG
jgi:hypothetical protein